MYLKYFFLSFFVILTAKAAVMRSSNDLAFVVGQKCAKTTRDGSVDSNSAVLTSKAWRPIYAARMTAARGKNQLSHLLALPRPLGARHGHGPSPRSVRVRKTAVVTSSAPASVEAPKRVQQRSSSARYVPQDVFMATLLP